MEQRPDLFAVALPAVGVMDMLRYDQFTGGRAWVTEYGSAPNPAQFPFLIKYSPLHNIKPGTCYPATLVTTADHDDRVVPSHSFKFTAALQAAQGCAEAGADPRRDAGLARLSADRQADRRARRPVGVRRVADGHGDQVDPMMGMMRLMRLMRRPVSRDNPGCRLPFTDHRTSMRAKLSLTGVLLVFVVVAAARCGPSPTVASATPGYSQTDIRTGGGNEAVAGSVVTVE